MLFKVQQTSAATRFHLGYPCLQGGHFAYLGVLVHDFDVGAVHGAPAFGVGPAARVDVRQAYVQLGQVVLSHFQNFELDGRRVVVLGPVELGEAGKHFLVRRQRQRTVGLLSGQHAFLVELLGNVVRFLVFGYAVQGAFVHEFKVGAGKTLGVAGGAGLDPGVKARFGPFAVDVLGDAGYGRVVGPAYLANDVVAVFAFIFKVAAGTGRGGLSAFGVGVLQRRIPVPLVAHHGDDLAVLAHGVGFPVVVVYPAVAGGARFRLARFGRGEFVTGVAGVAFVLVGVAHAAAFGYLTLRHGGKHGYFYVGFPVQGVRGASLRPLLVGPDEGVALGFALGKFCQVAGAAHVSRGHAQVFHVVGLALGVDVNVTVDTAYFLQLLVGPQPVHGAKVLLHFFQLGFLVEGRILRL